MLAGAEHPNTLSVAINLSQGRYADAERIQRKARGPGAWGGGEYGAEGSVGRKGGWGGREHGAVPREARAEGRLGRKPEGVS